MTTDGETLCIDSLYEECLNIGSGRRNRCVVRVVRLVVRTVQKMICSAQAMTIFTTHYRLLHTPATIFLSAGSRAQRRNDYASQRYESPGLLVIGTMRCGLRLYQKHGSDRTTRHNWTRISSRDQADFWCIPTSTHFRDDWLRSRIRRRQHRSSDDGSPKSAESTPDNAVPAGFVWVQHCNHYPATHDVSHNENPISFRYYSSVIITRRKVDACALARSTAINKDQ